MEASQLSLGIVIGLVLVALAFDFMNGFHDAANSIATVVSTRVLKPHQAVLLAAVFNVIAVFVFHLSVATTVGKGIIDQGIVDHYVVLGALIGAISWNIITWYYGIPSSSSHALIGGLVGAGVAKAGTWALIPAGLLKTVAFIFLSPLLGFVIGSLLLLAISWLFARWTPSRVDRLFRKAQLFSSSLYSLGHGRRAASTGFSARRSFSPRRCTASGTAATTRRKPSASSGCCSSRAATRASMPRCRRGW